MILNFTCMLQYITVEYHNPLLNIAFRNIKEVWLLTKPPLSLIPAIHRGELVYRVPQTGKRISYRQLKKGLIKRTLVIAIPFHLLPF